MIISKELIHIPLEDLNITQPFIFMLLCCVLVLGFALFLKVTKAAPHMHAGIVAALSILILYVACLWILTFNPLGLKNYIAPLPFINVDNGILTLELSDMGENGLVRFPEFCSDVLSMLVLAFLVNQVYAYKPGNMKSPAWLVYRLGCTGFCIGVHFAIYWVLRKILSYIPAGSLLESFLPFAPIVVLGLVLFTFFLGCLKQMMVYFYKVVNPTFEGLNGFYFKNKFGTILTRAVWSTLFLTIFAYNLQALWEDVVGVASVPIGAFTTSTGICGLVTLFLLWLIVGFLL